MLNLQNFCLQIQESQQRLQFIKDYYANSENPAKDFQDETLTELSIALEELNIATEELRWQNEQLSKTQIELELKQQHYQDLFELAPDAYLVTDEKAVIQEANCAAANLLNVPKKYLTGKPLDIFISKSNRENLNNSWSEIQKLLITACNNAKKTTLSSKKNNFTSIIIVQNREIFIQPREKKSLPVAISVSATFNSQGEAMGLRWMFRDLSDRLQAEEQIRQQAALLDITTDAIFVHDLEDKILFWNQGAERLYGWTKQEALGKNVTELLYLEFLPLQAEIQQQLLEKNFWSGELNQVTRLGKEIIVESRQSLVRDEQKNPKSILVVNSDITLSKQLEEQTHRHQRLESIGALASGIAHDLSNILTPILGVAQILPLKFPNADAPSRQMFQIIESNAKRGADLLKQILMFSRGVEQQRVLIAPSSLIGEIKQVFCETFPKSIISRKEVPADLWAINGNFTQLHQVMMNLCINARDAMPNGGTLNISAKNLLIDESYVAMEAEAKVGPYVVITVSDTGIGMTEAVRERIFEPFFTTKEMGKGTGLGLSTVKGIIKNHNGFIKVASQLGKGCEFNIFLPAVETKVEESSKLQKLPFGNGQSILVVDDEVFICNMLKALLETYNYKVMTSKDGIEAIALYAQHKHQIDVILMDLMMPLLDGATTILALEKINENVKIIVTSGTASSEDYSNSSIKAFLSKPYTSEELLTTLHEVLKN